MPLLRLLGPYVIYVYPIGILILFFYLRAWLVANRDLRSSLFTLEREMAVARMRRAAVSSCIVFGLLLGLFSLQFFIGPSIQLADLIRPTPTPEFYPRVTYVLTPTPSPTVLSEPTSPSPTPTRRPTQRPVTATPLASPTATSAPIVVVPPARCANPGIRIVYPGDGIRIQGRVEIRGTAKIQNFQFYKIEIGAGEQPTRWDSISEVHRNPVTDGVLDTWDTNTVPPGPYSLRLVVVDTSGNFDTPCVVHVTVYR